MNETEQRKVLALLGLGARARNVTIGVDQVRAAVMKGRVKAAVVALDASRHSRDKVIPLLEAKRVVWMEGPSAMAIGAAVGKSATAVVGVLDADLANGICAAAGIAAKRV